jgi:hypothetical protein
MNRSTPSHSYLTASEGFLFHSVCFALHVQCMCCLEVIKCAPSIRVQTIHNMSTLTVPSNLTSTHNHHQGWDELPTGAKVLIIIMLCGMFLVLLMALLIATDCTCAVSLQSELGGICHRTLTNLG